MCFAVKMTCGRHNLTSVKVAVAVQIIQQFASNLAPLLKCLKLTLICCEDVPLLRNSLNSQPQITLAKHGRILGDVTPHSDCMSTPTVCRGRAIYHYTASGNKQESVHRKLFCACLVCLLPSRSAQPDVHIDDGDPIRCICPRAKGNQCRQKKGN